MKLFSEILLSWGSGGAWSLILIETFYDNFLKITKFVYEITLDDWNMTLRQFGGKVFQFFLQKRYTFDFFWISGSKFTDFGINSHFQVLCLCEEVILLVSYSIFNCASCASSLINRYILWLAASDANEN